jgi:hypothetical protein
MKSEDREPVSFKAFARILGERSASYVHQLKSEGRLVLTDDGKRVRVQESLARVRATADPGKAGVAARHAAARAGKQAVAPADLPPPETPPAGAASEEEPVASSGYQHWRERGERAKALAAERENAIAEGKLLDAGEVAAVVSAATVTLRSRFEHLPDILGPQLAGVTDEAQARAMLAEAIEHELEEASRQFAALAREGDRE